MALELLKEEEILFETRINRLIICVICVFYLTLIFAIVKLVHVHKDAFMVYEIRMVAYLLSMLDPRASALNNIDVESIYYKFSYVISLGIIFVTLVRLLVPVAEAVIRLNSRYILTNQRVLVVEGFLLRKITAVPLGRIESVTLRKLPLLSISLLLRGYGKLRLKLFWPRKGGAFQTALCRLIVRPADAPQPAEKS